MLKVFIYVAKCFSFPSSLLLQWFFSAYSSSFSSSGCWFDLMFLVGWNNLFIPTNNHFSYYRFSWLFSFVFFYLFYTCLFSFVVFSLFFYFVHEWISLSENSKKHIECVLKLMWSWMNVPIILLSNKEKYK